MEETMKLLSVVCIICHVMNRVFSVVELCVLACVRGVCVCMCMCQDRNYRAFRVTCRRSLCLYLSMVCGVCVSVFACTIQFVV